MEFLKGVHSGFTAAGPIWERGTVHFVGWLVGSATADSNNGLKTENNLKGTRPRGS